MKMTEKIKDTVRLSMGTILVFLSILSTTVMGFQYVKSLAEENKSDIVEHKTSDEKKWDVHGTELREVRNDIDDLKSVQTEMRVSQGKQETHYVHIQAELNEIKQILKTFEVE